MGVGGGPHGVAARASKAPFPPLPNSTPRKDQTMKKQMKQFLAKTEGEGWTVTPTKSGHYQLRHPNPTVGLVVVSGTPSDQHAFKKMEADKRRALRAAG